MKRANTILTCVLAAGMAAAQNPSTIQNPGMIQNTRAIMQGVQANETRATNQALSVANPSTPAALAKPSASAVTVAPKTMAPKTAAAKPSVVVAKAPAKAAAPKVAAPKVAAAKAVAPKVAAQKSAPKSGTAPAVAKTAEAAAAAKTEGDPKGPEKVGGKWSMTGKRDPFISPVVYQTGASNCTSGKKCLEIGAINLKGVVHSDNGFIAVVTNNLNKAYFLRENDPVFDGYVVKITGDSIIFQETVQDRLGKTFTKEVVKKLTTPSV
jgi:Tfp pilus assembly protein PilP